MCRSVFLEEVPLVVGFTTRTTSKDAANGTKSARINLPDFTRGKPFLLPFFAFLSAAGV